MTSIVLFLIGFVILVKGADVVVDGASALAKKFSVSDLVIGLTVVALGTTAPELFVTIFSTIEGTTDLALGNIVGSNLANILFILGVAAVIYTVKINKGIVRRQIPFHLFAVVLLITLVNDSFFNPSRINMLSKGDGVILLVLLGLYLYHLFGVSKLKPEKTLLKIGQKSVLKSIFFILLGLAGLALGAHWIVEGAIEIAQRLNISETVIGLTIVALGTSLPELATVLTAVKKNHADLAVGNAVGASIINIFFILGVVSVFSPMQVPTSLNFDLLLLLIAALMILGWLIFNKKKLLSRRAGFVFLGFYLFFVLSTWFIK